MKNKTKNPEIMGAKDKIGATLLSTSNSVAGIFMSTMFMSFLTDYAGLGSWAATLATVLLLVARFIDAFDDPIQSMIMDSAKPGKHGKYKPFFLLSTIMITIGVALLYSLPAGIASKPVLVSIWVIVFYFVCDIGVSFYNGNLLARFMTSDPNERGKLIVGPRIWTMIISMAGAGITSLAVGMYESFGSYNAVFRLIASVIALVAGVLSFIGWLMVKERHIVENDDDNYKTGFKDFIALMKENDAMMVNFFKQIFAGFIYTMLFAAPLYYIKWGLCCDLTTGAIDMAKYGKYSIVMSLLMMVPLLLGVIIASPIFTKIFKGNPIKMQSFDLLCEGIGGLLIFLVHITGLVNKFPVLFFIGMFIMALALGIDFLPSGAISMEIMDYTIYKTGKDRSAMSSVLEKFLDKAQNAVSSTIVGAVLIAVGYNVDSVTGDYIGELSNIPSMLTGMAVITGLVPAVLAIISVIILKKYPIDDKIRLEMKNMDANKSEA